MATTKKRLMLKRGQRQACARKGFTLIEVLLVAAILGLLAAVTIPTVVRSMRGNRLRAAARTIVMSGRYARSMALLKQRDIVIKIDAQRGRVSVHLVRTDFRSDNEVTEVQLVFGDEENAKVEKELDTEGSVVADVSVALEEAEFTRQLDRVTIEEFELENPEDEEVTLPGSVLYFSNGTCTPYSVILVDESGESMLVTVDTLSSAEMERLQ
jgi:type II secretion system protein H